MKNFLTSLVFIAISCIFAACSEDSSFLESEANLQDLVSTELTTDYSQFNESDSIISLTGDSTAMRKRNVHTRSASASSSYLYEELHQLDQIPIYLQVKGNSSTKQFLDVSGEGKELTFANFKDGNLAQQFYIRTVSKTILITDEMISNSNGYVKVD